MACPLQPNAEVKMADIGTSSLQTSSFNDDELACLARCLDALRQEGEGGVALGFGLSEVARFMFEHGVWNLQAVDDDLNWIKEAELDRFFAFFLQKKRLLFHHADIGPQQAWGYPATGPNPLWLRYHQEVWQKIVDPERINLVFLDGRFRVACACQALLRCGPGITLYVHDFWPRRNYHVLLEFMELQDRAGSAAVLRLQEKEKPKTWRKVALALQHHQFDLR